MIRFFVSHGLVAAESSAFVYLCLLRSAHNLGVEGSSAFI